MKNKEYKKFTEMNTEKAVIVTDNYIYCANCKGEIVPLSKLTKKIEENYELHKDCAYGLFCDVCEDYKLVDVGIEVSKQVYIEENERLFVYYTYLDGNNLTKHFSEYVYEGLPINAPYFSKDKLGSTEKVKKRFNPTEDILCQGNINRVIVENEGTENCTLILKKEI